MYLNNLNVPVEKTLPILAFVILLSIVFDIFIFNNYFAVVSQATTHTLKINTPLEFQDNYDTGIIDINYIKDDISDDILDDDSTDTE